MSDEPKVPTKLYGEAAKLSDAGELENNLRQTNETFSQDIDGIITATRVYVGQFNNVVKHGRSARFHPHYRDLVKTNYGVQRIDADLAQVTCTYKGIFEGDTFTRYTLDSNTKAEPIQTHPFFKEGKAIDEGAKEFQNEDEAYGYYFGGEIAGQPEGSNQAFYEAAGGGGGMRFKYFPKNALFNLPGVQSYLDFSVTMTVIIVSFAENDFKMQIGTDAEEGGYLYHVGAKVDPPVDVIELDKFAENRGDVEANYNWLVTRVNHEIVGSAWRQEIDFALSGYRGWNGLIYRKAELYNYAQNRFSDGNLP